MYTIDFHVCILIIMSKNVLLTLSVKKKRKIRLIIMTFRLLRMALLGGERKKEGERECERFS